MMDPGANVRDGNNWPRPPAACRCGGAAGEDAPMLIALSRKRLRDGHDGRIRGGSGPSRAEPNWQGTVGRQRVGLDRRIAPVSLFPSTSKVTKEANPRVVACEAYLPFPGCTVPAMVGSICIARTRTPVRHSSNWGEFAHLADHAELASGGEAQPTQDGGIAQELARIFSENSCAHWITRLTSSGIAATENTGIADFRDTGHIREAGLVVTRDHPGQGSADHLGNTAHLSATPMLGRRPTPTLGTDAEEILAETGLAKERIAQLIAKGVVVAV